jgi:enolase
VSREAYIQLLDEPARAYALFVVEDPLEEDDFEGHAEVTRRLGGTLIIGDDLFVTTLARLQRGVALGAANAMLLKPNMVGTINGGHGRGPICDSPRLSRRRLWPGRRQHR